MQEQECVETAGQVIMGNVSEPARDAPAPVNDADWLVDAGFWLAFFGFLFSFVSMWALTAIPAGIGVSCIAMMINTRRGVRGGRS